MFESSQFHLSKHELIRKNNNRKIAVSTDALIGGKKEAICSHQPQSAIVLEYGRL